MPDGPYGGSGSPAPNPSAVAGPSSQPAGPSPSPNAMERFWTQASSAASPRISQIRRRLPHFPSAPLRIQRVSQLDAELLDAELLNMLVEPLKASLAQIRSTLPDSLEPELLALLRLVLYKYSIWDRGASYGAMLQNLRYRNEWAHRGGLQSTFLSAPLSLTQRLLYPLLTIGVPYAYERLNRKMTSMSFSDLASDDPRRVLWSAIDAVQKAYEAAALANFISFLGDGRYRTVTDRLLGIRLTYAERTLNRNVSFEFLNRQLVWHAFTEFLLFLLPIIRPRQLLRRLMRLPTHPRILAFWITVLPIWLSKQIGLYRDQAGRPRYRLPRPVARLIGSQSTKGKRVANGQGKYADLPEGICAICWERVEMDASSSGSAPLSMGIPTSDPLDPSSGALAPSTSSSASRSSQSKQYHLASRAFGVSSTGIPYSAALVHTPYLANPCGCVYCYFCLAEKLLSSEAKEELEDSYASTSASAASEGSGHHGKSSGGDGVGAWDCLRCDTKVKGMERLVEQVEETEEEEAQTAHGGQRSKGKGKNAQSETKVEDEEELDLNDLTG